MCWAGLLGGPALGSQLPGSRRQCHPGAGARGARAEGTGKHRESAPFSLRCLSLCEPRRAQDWPSRRTVQGPSVKSQLVPAQLPHQGQAHGARRSWALGGASGCVTCGGMWAVRCHGQHGLVLGALTSPQPLSGVTPLLQHRAIPGSPRTESLPAWPLTLQLLPQRLHTGSNMQLTILPEQSNMLCISQWGTSLG